MSLLRSAKLRVRDSEKVFRKKPTQASSGKDLGVMIALCPQLVSMQSVREQGTEICISQQRVAGGSQRPQEQARACVQIRPVVK